MKPLQEPVPPSEPTGPSKCGLRNSECGIENQTLLTETRFRNLSNNLFEDGIQKEMTESNANKFIANTKQNYLKERTKAFALRIIKLVEGLPRSRTADILGKQLLKAGTSVGANYRAACRAKSPADFIAKMGIVEEGADETIYRMDLLILSDLLRKSDITDLLDNANQILAMTVSSIKTARMRKE